MTRTLLWGLILVLSGCSSTYYGMWEKLGYHKRDILVSRVEKARDNQQEAKETFSSALEQFKSVVDVSSSDLEDKYNKLNGELADCAARAQAVTERIDSVEKVAEDLFAEWENELDQYADANLRRASARQLKDTRSSYEKMVRAMRKAESTMRPVLSAFQDQVLFLKHNLNARAIASIQDTAADLETDIGRLIRDMERSIDEANAFIQSMTAG